MSTTKEDFLERSELAGLQLERLRQLFAEILPDNKFYAEKFAGADVANIDALSDLKKLPFTTKTELLEDQAAHPPYGRNLTYPLKEYSRFHQTSGTTGQPLRWLDTYYSWRNHVLHCWVQVLGIAGVTDEDRLFFPFSFGPFLGFWSAFEAACELGCLCLPGGGMTTMARLRFLLENEATVVLCTPTYSLHLAETAKQQNFDLAGSAVRALIVAGEPGGSIPATRQKIEQAWGARVFDHSGLTEVGPLSVECIEAPGGLHLLEGDYFVEIIDPATGEDVPPGEIGELVVTNFGRWASPLVRYRTGDLVKADAGPCPCGRTFLRLDGGIIGRSDELIHVRGNNVYPSALEQILRGFDEVAEYQIEVDRSGDMTELRIQVEPAKEEIGKDLADRIGRAIQDQLMFRAEVASVAPGTLPRYELKGKRVKVS